MKTIRVSKVKVESVNKLIALGYKVILTGTTPAPAVHPDYTYIRPVKPSQTRPNLILGAMGACTIPHVKRESK